MLTIDEIREAVYRAVADYNATVPAEKQLVRVELFGSYASGNATEDSDVDFLVEFARPTVGLFSLAAAMMALEEATGMEVDMVQLPIPEDSFLEIERTVPLYAAA